MAASAPFLIRPCTLEDAPAVLDLAAKDEERVNGTASQLGVTDVQDWWERVELATDSWLVVDAADASSGAAAAGGSGAAAPIAVAWVEREGDDLATSIPIPAVDRRELLPLLLDLTEARVRELGIPRVHALALVPDPELEAQLRGRGYTDVRHFWDMAIALDGPQPPAVLTGALRLDGVGPDDARAFYAAITEAFEDHWESHALPFEEWWQLRVGDANAELPWWFVVRDGEEVAAAIRAVPGRNGGVYVPTLGVRREWRGRGLGKALLRQVFDRAWAEGVDRVTLGVDSTNPTGATALYRGVGMVVEAESAVFELVLGGAS